MRFPKPSLLLQALRCHSVEYEDRHVTATPEGIRLDVVLAGLGSRFIAYAFDLFLQLVAFIVVAKALDEAVGSNPSEAAGLLAIGGLLLFALVDFVVSFVVFEMLFNGRSPGKRLAGLRVVRVGGQPVGFLASLLRNLLRIVDFLPALYTVGSVLILATNRNQRLGDLAAGTVVIRDRVAAERKVEPSSWASGPGFAAPAGTPVNWGLGHPSGPWLPPELAHWDVSAVPPEELSLARAFLANRGGYTPEARQRLSHQLANRIWPFVAGPSVPPHPEAFLEMVLQVKAARG
jgi:uncharacterized RDD family membrane protein YckC